MVVQVFMRDAETIFVSMFRRSVAVLNLVPSSMNVKYTVLGYLNGFIEEIKVDSLVESQ